MGTSFIIFSPLENDEDKFKENVNLLMQDLTGQNIDLDKYVTKFQKVNKNNVDEFNIN
ncbi:MAG: hypothetical protein IPJ26_05200 [Bacteroidetes bacterium]|nr:hypothetical protein [Bacteroidota bacterium]